MKHSKKKKKSQPPKQVGVKSAACEEEGEECKVLKGLMEVFTSVSFEETASAYREASGDPNKAAEILGGMAESTDDQATSCSSSSCSARLSSSAGSSSGKLFMESSCVNNGASRRGSRGSKQKKIIAATGTVSTVLGKEYVRSSPRNGSFKPKGHVNGPISKEDAEQFLCSMLGDDCELSMAVVRDVLCQCGYDVEQALSILLELSASSYEQSKNGQSCDYLANNKEDPGFIFDFPDKLTDRASDSTSHTSESDIQDNMCSLERHRNFSEVLPGSEVHSRTRSSCSESELPQKILDSLFNMPKSVELEAGTMNWRDIVKKMESFGHRLECDPVDVTKSEQVQAKRDEYQVSRKSATQHWDSMKSYYQKAATAFSNGEREYAAYLSEQGRVYNKMAREADEKASQEIFKARNKNIENVVTIDLHGQHVKQAIKFLKVHLLFGAYVCSVQIFRVITGCGSHGVGKSKLKQSVINLVEREGIKWREENRGTILIKLDGQREFSFVESESESE